MRYRAVNDLTDISRDAAIVADFIGEDQYSARQCDVCAPFGDYRQNVAFTYWQIVVVERSFLFELEVWSTPSCTLQGWCLDPPVGISTEITESAAIAALQRLRQKA